MKKLLALGVCLLVASPAMADWSVTETGPIDSNGGYGDALNGVFTRNFAGPAFDLGDIVFSGDVTSGDIGSYLSELAIAITDPNNVTGYLENFVSGTTWTGTQAVGLTIGGAGALWGTATPGTWTFTFYETYDDTSADPSLLDAYWNNLSFDFLAAPVYNYIWVEDFEAGLPAGWTVVDHLGGSPVWDTNTYWGRSNYTPGSGQCMMIDSDGAGSVDVDTSLVSPFFSVPVGGALDFDYDWNAYTSGNLEYGDVDVSTDGTNWTTLATWDGTVDDNGHASIPLTAYEGQSVQVRFHYYDANYEYWWQVDNVGLTPEPATLALLGFGALAMLRRRR